MTQQSDLSKKQRFPDKGLIMVFKKKTHLIIYHKEINKKAANQVFRAK